jgi:hypothetical protein
MTFGFSGGYLGGFDHICACIREWKGQGARSSQHYCMSVLMLVSRFQSAQGGCRNRDESGAVTAALQEAQAPKDQM